MKKKFKAGDDVDELFNSIMSIPLEDLERQVKINKEFKEPPRLDVDKEKIGKELKELLVNGQHIMGSRAEYFSRFPKHQCKQIHKNNQRCKGIITNGKFCSSHEPKIKSTDSIDIGYWSKQAIKERGTKLHTWGNKFSSSEPPVWSVKHNKK